MAVQINTTAASRRGVLAWLARSGDSLARQPLRRLPAELRTPHLLRLRGRRSRQPVALRSAAHRRHGTVDPTFALSAVTPQPATFLELISAQLNNPNAPLQVVAQRTIDGYASSTPNQPRLIAVSGTNFRVFPDPGVGSYTATLRYYQKLATPAGATVNAILTGSPDVYLYGCLVEPRSSPRTSRAPCATSRSTTPASRASTHARNASRAPRSR